MFLAFGEIMMRVMPPDRRRWRQSLPGRVDVTWGGGEANVCASLALFGHDVRYMTSLPRHPISESLVASLRSLSIDTSPINWRDESRLGIYFVEAGANQRGSNVIYDRQFSAISEASEDEYDFDKALDGVTWLHLTGITPAISENACNVNLSLAKAAKTRGVTVSCDLNYRKKLWNWRSDTTRRELARECMSELLPFVDLVIGNEEDASDVLNIHAGDTDVTQGQLNVAAYGSVASQIVERFPNVSRVAITLRESVSADHNNWGAILYTAEDKHVALAPLSADGQYQPYEIRDILDRVGSGDSFAAGLIHALNTPSLSSPDAAIRFAVAASCLKHSIHGDFNYVTEQEVLALMGGDASGRVQR
ncbi:MAG: 2-dehydro-3-deoxygluconokinase [Pirellulaceae bacterium]